MKLAATALLGLLAATAACGNDDGGAVLDGGTMCSTVSPTFTNLHTTIFSAPRCNQDFCHGSRSTQGNLLLGAAQADAYASITGATDRSDSKTQYPKRVEPMMPDKSFLWIKLTVPTVPGGLMPLGGKLNDCELAAVQEWITKGAPND